MNSNKQVKKMSDVDLEMKIKILSQELEQRQYHNKMKDYFVNLSKHNSDLKLLVPKDEEMFHRKPYLLIKHKDQKIGSCFLLDLRTINISSNPSAYKEITNQKESN